MHCYLAKMLEIYKPDGYDWMNFTITKNNKISFHHISKKESRGKSRPDNGAILTKVSHRFLHYLEYICPEAFNDYQALFYKINESKAPRTPELIKEADLIMQNILDGVYCFNKNIDIDVIKGSFAGQYVMKESESKILKKHLSR